MSYLTRLLPAALLAVLLTAAADASAREQTRCAVTDMACRAFAGTLPPGMSHDGVVPPDGGPRLPYRLGTVVLSLDLNALHRERRCLTLAMIGEARGEPAVGMEAVLWVILNRVASPLYADTPCTVIAERGQFEFLSEARFAPQATAVRAGALPPRLEAGRGVAAGALKTARALAYQAFAGGLIHDKTLGATHFLAPEVMNRRGGLPAWAEPERVTVEIGGHRFYRAADAGRPHILAQRTSPETPTK